MVDVEHLGGDVVALEAADVLTAVLDTFLTAWGSFLHLTDGGSQCLRIVGGDCVLTMPSPRA